MIEVDSIEDGVAVTTSTSDIPFADLRRLLSGDRPDQCIRTVLAELASSLGSSIALVYDLNPVTRRIQHNAELSPSPPFDSDISPLSDDAILPWIDRLAAGFTVALGIDDLRPQDRTWFETNHCRSLVLAPLRPTRSLSGLLVFATPYAPNELSASASGFIAFAAQTLSAALARPADTRSAELHADQRLTTIVTYAADSIVVIDEFGTILFHSPPFALGKDPTLSVSLGENAFKFVHPDDLPRVQRSLAELLLEPGGIRAVDVRVRQDDGSWRYFDTIGTNQLNNPAVNGIVITANDVTERKELEERLNWQVLHDPLTALPNRILLFNDLTHALARIARTDETIALLFLDLDGFKEINDNFGHPAGDEALVLIAERLRTTVRSGETVARLGGDEFIVLLEGLTDSADAERAADRILAALSIPISVNNQRLAITTSIGIAVASSEATTAEVMLSEADTALYAAKRAGKARYLRFVPAMRTPGADDGNSC